METRLTNPFFMALKAVPACAIALALDQLLGNPDHVTSTFVAVLCMSPTVLIGVRNAWAQVIGSLVGGLWGTLANLLGVDAMIGLPLAVGAAIGSTFALRISEGYPVAAFTALFMILVQQATPIDTFETRFLALFIAAVSSFVVNAGVSALIYRRIYRERLDKVECFVFDSFLPVIEGDLDRADQGFELLGILQGQLRNTLAELALRRAWKTHDELKPMLVRTQRLNYLLHLVWDLAWLFREQEVPQHEVVAFIGWIRKPDQAHFPFLPDPLLGVQKRIVHVLSQLEEGARGEGRGNRGEEGKKSGSSGLS
ncbi:MAG: aromatic acid exporter family protein [Candidatus Sericytochromatia bacterium]